MYAVLVLKQLVEECSWFLPELQVGFRKSRDAQEMIFMVQAWAEAARAQGTELTLYFSDFKGAFTSLSHTAIDAALAEAGASPKTSLCDTLVLGCHRACTIAGRCERNPEKLRVRVRTITRILSTY
jgi:hypothetical protein